MKNRIGEVLKTLRRFVLVAPSPALRYGLAGIAALAAVGARSALDPVLGPYSQFPLGSLAVIVAARFGGRGPGLATTALSAFGILRFVIEPSDSLVVPNREASAGLALFVVVGTLLSLLVGQLRESLLSTARAEGDLRRASEQRELALAAAKLGAWDYRFERGEMFLDERCRNILGVTADLCFDDAVARIHGEERAAVIEAMERALAGVNGGAFEREFRVVWPDNSVHWVASHGQVFFEGDGARRRAVRFVGVSTEITERRLADERLRQTQKLESITLLAGGIAHDFNNLLTVIMGSASSALAERPSCEHSQAILSASKRASYLTKQLLAYAGKGAVIVRLLDLTELVSQSKGLLTLSVPKCVDISYNLSEDLPCLEADPSRIEQILMNLVVNAGESIPSGSNGLIEIATSSCEVTAELARQRSEAYDVASGAYVCLQVRDNGIGMDQATLSRVFDPFYTTKFTGRGLGLAAVHGIVRSRHGFIDVRSLPGAGTTFRVLLPASPKRRPTEFAQPTTDQQRKWYANWRA
ncbi:MAG TPA: ATP-binding protein [Geobacterales bacterium]|nr:ATP-binding protein [Geobacterales bacterium]